MAKNDPKADAPILTGVGAVGSGSTPEQTDNPEAIGGPEQKSLDDLVGGPPGSNKNPLKVEVVSASASRDEPEPEVSSDHITEEMPGGAKLDETEVPPERAQFDTDNTLIAPVPRNQIDPVETLAIDPMKRQPGVAPDERMAQITQAEEAGDGAEDYSMTMPFWDGHQMHEKGTVLRFKPGEAPYGAKRVR